MLTWLAINFLKMKKSILAMLALAGLSHGVQAQLANETFNNPGLPAGWSMIKVDNGTVSNIFAAPIPTVLTQQAWMKRLRNTGDSAMLTVSNFTPAGKADRWLVTPSFTVNDPKMIIKWEDWQSSDATMTDSIQVWVSTTGGATPASFTTKIFDGRVTPFDAAIPYGTHGASLAAFNGQSVRVAFRNNNTQQGALRIDNVGTQVLNHAVDAGISNVLFNRLVATSGSYPVRIEVKNNGANAITSIEASYKLDAGTAVTQTFNGLFIAPLSTAVLTFTTQINNPSVGAHTITADIFQVNGGADELASNNQSVFNFAVATASVPRNGLIEEFTSSTCAPCASFNTWYDPMLTTNNANDPSSRLTVIKYQMNWPAVNPPNVLDQSYNPDGATRRGVYGINAIPAHVVNGMPGIELGSAQNLYQTELNNSKQADAYVTIGGSYTIKGDSLIANVTVTPNFTMNNAPYKLYMAATEYKYTNPNATTSQSQYYHAMRKMLPDADGITITNLVAGQTQTFTQKWKFTTGNVAQTNYNFWTHPIPGRLVAFIQDPTTLEVLQSVAIPSQWPTSVGTLNNGLGNMQLFPNPAKENAHLLFTLEKAGDVNISVVDALGKVVYSYSEKMGNGEQQVNLSLSSLAAGVYNVIVKTENASETQRLNVVK